MVSATKHQNYFYCYTKVAVITFFFSNLIKKIFLQFIYEKIYTYEEKKLIVTSQTFYVNEFTHEIDGVKRYSLT